MMTSSRPRDVGGSFASRRGHSNQLSISDPSHHVTEAIGTMYGESDDDSGTESRHDNLPFADKKSRPLSFLASPVGGEQIRSFDNGPERLRLARTTSDQSPLTQSLTPDDAVNGGVKKSSTMPVRMTSKRGQSYEGASATSPGLSPMSPTMSLRDVQQAESSQFPLGAIENPSDIAQELSNLQALRRMSMDVGNTSDPDLLPFNGVSLMAMPTIAPTGEDDEGDISRLLWVPAQVHPELAPDQFKNFLENRVKTIKRRSGESMLSVDGIERNNSGSLRRKKSMLSRQIDSAGGMAADEYVDGAERLERRNSASGRSTPELSLDELVKDPTKAVQKLARESRETQEAGMEDLPILPVAPGMGLRRSTKTTYRKGGSVRGERVPFSKRLAAAREAERDAEKDSEDFGAPPMPKAEVPQDGYPLTRVQTDPTPASTPTPAPVTENFSRPTRSVRRQQTFQRDNVSSPVSPATPATAATPRPSSSDRPKTADSSWSAAPSVPQIVETPPPTEDDDTAQPSLAARQFPQRSSSQSSQQQPTQQPEPRAEPPKPPRELRRPASVKKSQENLESALPTHETGQGRTINDMAQHPSPIPGNNTRTDSVTFIPTMAPEEKRKSKDESEPSKSTGWKWFRGEDREKKKREKEEQAKKARGRTSAEKANAEDARLDVLQNSIDNAQQKGRESLLLDRDSVDSKLQDERKKETGRKSSESKKERDGFFGSIFGGKSKRGDKDDKSGRGKQQALSPEPPPRILRPDVDYHYTRFPIVEERAIYRMAHIKLANPRRSLLSQVLLSNFMYSYLAKVQAMHPQMNVPISPQQKRAEEERRRQEEEQQKQQQYLMEQQMQQEAEQDDGKGGFDQYNFEYHRAGNQYGDQHQQQHDEYGDDSQIYEYDHGDDHDRQHQQGGGGYQNGQQIQGSAGGRQYYEYEQHEDGRRRDDDMW